MLTFSEWLVRFKRGKTDIQLLGLNLFKTQKDAMRHAKKQVKIDPTLQAYLYEIQLKEVITNDIFCDNTSKPDRSTIRD